ncbi:MAG: hypothetical protein HFI25_03050, partial [Lachnospiraceae bacterium]|nr:hypothetical protein [Lachnospiraceae bacterium]
MSEKRHKRHRKQGINNRLVLGIGLLTLWILAFSIAVFFLFFSGKDSTKGQTDEEVISREEDTAEEGREEKKEPEEKKEDMEEKEDPQSETNQISEETGAESEITKVLLSQNAQETDEVTIGIDVSRFQGTIDWKAVAEAG